MHANFIIIIIFFLSQQCLINMSYSVLRLEQLECTVCDCKMRELFTGLNIYAGIF